MTAKYPYAALDHKSTYSLHWSLGLFLKHYLPDVFIVYEKREGQYSQLKALVVGHSATGLVSSILDNIPLTAAIIKMLPESVEYAS